MKGIAALKKFLSEGEHGEATGARELVELKKACTPEEWKKMGKDACEALGEEYEEA